MADALTMLGLTASDTVNALDVPSELEKTRALCGEVLATR